jgi:hypothetical protein
MPKLSFGALLLAVVFAAGCGGGGGGGSTQPSGEAAKPAEQVVADAVKAADAASSVHMSGQVVDGGRQIGVDLAIVRDKGATGTLTLGGAGVDLIVIGNTAYIRGGPDFWRRYTHVPGVSQVLANKWLKFSANNPQLGPLTALANDRALFNQLSATNGKVANRGAATYNGQSVVEIYDSPQNGTLYVAAAGTPYPVALVKGSQSSTGGKVTFDQWNQPVALTAPKGALDFSKVITQ